MIAAFCGGRPARQCRGSARPPIARVIRMYINPTLLLLLALTFVFSPTLQDWVLSGGSAWYRPYLVWIGLIAFIYWSQRGKPSDEF